VKGEAWGMCERQGGAERTRVKRGTGHVRRTLWWSEVEHGASVRSRECDSVARVKRGVAHCGKRMTEWSRRGQNKRWSMSHTRRDE